MTSVGRAMIDVSLVEQLIGSQFPHWADLPIRPVIASGWDNRCFRLGETMVARLPSAECYVPQVAKEQHWLPELAKHLPFAIPAPLAVGSPGFGYPWPWSVYRWVSGEPASMGQIGDPELFADDLARFQNALRAIDADTGPPAGGHNFGLGGPLSCYDSQMRRAIAALDDEAEAGEAMTIWEAARATCWRARPVWVHGDFAVGNLLVENGRLCAVIDFGNLGCGDPACDLVIAWTMLRGDASATFRRKLSLDPATWARARGWALWKALILVTGIADGAADEVARARATLDDILARG